MRAIFPEKLTSLEKAIYKRLSSGEKDIFQENIFSLAKWCDVSPSKISKFARKLGYRGFKDFKISFGEGKPVTPLPSKYRELERIRQFCQEFPLKILDEIVTLISSHSKVVFYGQGSSFFCANFFVQRFRRLTQNDFSATNDLQELESELSPGTLFILLSVSGHYYNIQEVMDMVTHSPAKSLLIIEEFNDQIHLVGDRVIYLTEGLQHPTNEPEIMKSRTLFFLLFETVLQQIQNQ